MFAWASFRNLNDPQEIALLSAIYLVCAVLLCVHVTYSIQPRVNVQQPSMLGQSLNHLNVNPGGELQQCVIYLYIVTSVKS